MNRTILVVTLSLLPAILWACSGEGTKVTESVVPQTPSPTVQESTPTPMPTPSPTVDVSDHINIPHIKLNAPLVLGKVGSDNMIPQPDNDSVEIVGFSDAAKGTLGGLPGSGNSVMIGMLNSGAASCQKGTVPPPCDAIMKDIHLVSLGDQILITWQRQSFEYRVVAICNSPADKLPAGIFATTPQERVTLMTAGGDFVEKTGSYTSWLIVIAEKQGSSASCPAGANLGPPKVTDVTKGGS